MENPCCSCKLTGEWPVQSKAGGIQPAGPAGGWAAAYSCNPCGESRLQLQANALMGNRYCSCKPTPCVFVAGRGVSGSTGRPCR